MIFNLYGIDFTVDCVCVPLVLCVFYPDVAVASLWHFCFGREAWVQQDDAQVVCDGFVEGLGYCFRPRCSVPGGVLVHFRVGWG